MSSRAIPCRDAVLVHMNESTEDRTKPLLDGRGQFRERRFRARVDHSGQATERSTGHLGQPSIVGSVIFFQFID